MRIVRYLSAIALLLLACSPAAMQQMQKQYETQNSGFSPNYDAGKVYSLAVLPPKAGGQIDNRENLGGFYDFIGLTMLQTGHFAPVERGRIDAVLKEQEFGTSGVVDPATAARLGKVVGADAVMMTNIAFTKHDEFFGDSPDQRETELYVKIVLTSTAEILYYGRGEGSSFSGELEAWQGALQLAIGAIKRK